jgi:hypothetical protein
MFRNQWNFSSQNLIHELLTAMAESVFLARPLSMLKTENDLNYVRTGLGAANPFELPFSPFSSKLGVFTSETEARSLRSAKLRSEEQSQLLKFSRLGNYNVSEGDEITFSFDFTEGPNPANNLDLLMDVCDSQAAHCWYGYLDIPIFSLKSSALREQGSVTTAQATLRIGNWLAEHYQINNLSIAPNYLGAPNYQGRMGTLLLEGFQFVKQDGVRFETYQRLILVSIDFKGNSTVTPGNIVEFKLSIK